MVKEYQKHQMEYKDDVKKKVARQVRIVKEDATDAEIDEVMASGGTQQVLQSAILRTAADPVREAFEKAQDKYRDVQRLGQVRNMYRFKDTGMCARSLQRPVALGAVFDVLLTYPL